MSKKKKIPCRVCGKLFTPCSYCQSNTGEFRWRNFACSIKCAKKYIDDTVAYRSALNNTEKSAAEDTKAALKKPTIIKDKTNKNSFTDDGEKTEEKTKEKTFKNIKTD